MSTPAQTPSEHNPRLVQALDLAQTGFYVLPLYGIRDGHCTCAQKADCPCPGKHPMTSNGHKDATNDTAVITDWWTRHPDANIGIRPKGSIIIDIDPRRGGDESLKKLEEQYGKLPETPTTLTSGGGQHLYFTLPEGTVIKGDNQGRLLGKDNPSNNYAYSVPKPEPIDLLWER